VIGTRCFFQEKFHFCKSFCTSDSSYPTATVRPEWEVASAAVPTAW
jgi:hypothetical protein